MTPYLLTLLDLLPLLLGVVPVGWAVRAWDRRHA
jgi:hypothetical protein